MDLRPVQGLRDDQRRVPHVTAEVAAEAPSGAKPAPQTLAPPSARVALIRGARILAAVLLFLVLLRIWWGWYADRQIHRVVFDAHQHHEPVSPEELAAQVPTSPTGAAAVYASAMLTFRPSTGRWTAPKSYVALPAPDDATGNALVGDVARNSALLARLRAARSLPTGSWGAQPVHPIRLGLFSRIFGVFQLSDLLAWEFCIDHVKGNDAQALEAAQDWLKFSDVIDARAGMAGLRWSSLSIQREALKGLRAVAPELRLADAASDVSTHAATPKQVRQLIETLLDERDLREGGAKPCIFLRAVALDEAQDDVVDSHAGNALLGRLLQPAFNLRAVRDAHRAESYIRATAAPNWPQASGMLSFSREAVEPFLQSAAHALVEPINFDPTQVEEQFQIIAQRRITAAMLALRLYAADHDGQYPTSLNQLVPDYLPAVPIDAMAGDDKPLGFVAPNGPSGAVYLLSRRGTAGGVHDEGLRVAGAHPWLVGNVAFEMGPCRPAQVASPSTREAQKHD